MTTAPKILGLLRRSPRSTGDATPTSARTPTGELDRRSDISPRTRLLTDILSLFLFCWPDIDNVVLGLRDAAVVTTAAAAPSQPGIRTNGRMSAFEVSVSVFMEAASLASSIPYLGVVAGLFLQIIRIKSVRLPPFRLIHAFSFFSFFDWVNCRCRCFFLL
jgi:hypothetical protein